MFPHPSYRAAFTPMRTRHRLGVSILPDNRKKELCFKSLSATFELLEFTVYRLVVLAGWFRTLLVGASHATATAIGWIVCEDEEEPLPPLKGLQVRSMQAPLALGRRGPMGGKEASFPAVRNLRGPLGRGGAKGGTCPAIAYSCLRRRPLTGPRWRAAPTSAPSL